MVRTHYRSRSTESDVRGIPFLLREKRGLPVTFRTRIKEFRARYDMTQDDLARKVGVRRETISFLERGRYNPSLKLAHEVSIALNTSIDELFIFDDEEGGD
ncbi:helix-turn-helix transcriptional regulator [Candidatus Bathyarchaeota archaeon]|nr:helix-turn-helix transcriptional regulator [Candidatus Bathyarchaeota archaeon]